MAWRPTRPSDGGTSDRPVRKTTDRLDERGRPTSHSGSCLQAEDGWRKGLYKLWSPPGSSLVPLDSSAVNSSTTTPLHLNTHFSLISLWILLTASLTHNRHPWPWPAVPTWYTTSQCSVLGSYQGQPVALIEEAKRSQWPVHIDRRFNKVKGKIPMSAVLLVF